MVTIDPPIFKEVAGDFTQGGPAIRLALLDTNWQERKTRLHTLFGNDSPPMSLRGAGRSPYLNHSVSDSPSTQILTSD